MIRYLPCLFILFTQTLYSQHIRGKVTDGKNEGVPSAIISVEGSKKTITTSYDGGFYIKVSGFPVIISVSHPLYEISNDTISGSQDSLRIVLKEKAFQFKSASITINKAKDKRKESPVTVESIGLEEIKQTPAANFYEGLSHLKGVDMVSASLGFRVINTRGFNSTRPVRSLQLLDGVDNQAPGLNFSLGNFAGALDIDLLRADIVVGANSATFGPNAFNGVINMSTKDPFKYKGLNVQIKAGERGLFETQIRYAKAFKNASGKELAAFKIGLMYMKAYDWVADNYSQTNGSYQAVGNPGGYDAVNRYGDENLTSQTNNFLGGTFRWDYPGLGVFHRTGYNEIDLVDYNTKNIKVNGAFHYKMKKSTRFIASYNLGYGTTVYQGDNRYSLKDIVFQQYKLELNRANKWFIRAYTTRENAGNSYDAVFTAVLLQNRVKSNSQFLSDYLDGYANKVMYNLLPTIPGAGNVYDQIPLLVKYRKTSDSLLAIPSNIDLLREWHKLARAYADGPALFYKSRLVPGTPEFNTAFNEITSNSTYLDGGSRFYDRSSLYHLMGERKFSWKKIGFTTGGNFRIYIPDSRGTIFSDTGGRKIYNHEFGGFVQAEKKWIQDRLKLTMASRVDKNRNFNFLFSPATSLVYNSRNKKHFYRLSFTSAIRNPTLQDQYLYYNVGRAILLGNIDGVKNMVEIPSLINYLNSLGADRSLLKWVSLKPIVPEKVKSVEIGYKGELIKNLFIDMSYFYSWYRDFLGFRLLSDTSGFNFGQSFQFYRVAANSTDIVMTQGFSFGYNYYFAKKYSFSGNYSWNRLDRNGSEDPIIPAFNTPEHKFNIGLGATELVLRKGRTDKVLKNPGIWRDYGFNINYKWNKGFLYEGSPQFTGFVPSYDMLDVQVNKKIIKSKALLKIGASNVLNNLKFQVYGGPRIGRMAYVSILFELD